MSLVKNNTVPNNGMLVLIDSLLEDYEKKRKQAARKRRHRNSTSRKPVWLTNRSIKVIETLHEKTGISLSEFVRIVVDGLLCGRIKKELLKGTEYPEKLEPLKKEGITNAF